MACELTILIGVWHIRTLTKPDLYVDFCAHVDIVVIVMIYPR